MDKFKPDEPVETNATEIAIETKKIKPKTEKVKSFDLEKKFDIEVDAEDEPKQHKNMKQKIQK